MKTILRIVVAALIIAAPGLAQAVEVKAKAGTHIVVFGIPKTGECVAGANGNKICGGTVEFANLTVPAAGQVDVPLTRAQKNGLMLICVKVHGSMDNPVCKPPSTSTLKL